MIPFIVVILKNLRTFHLKKIMIGIDPILLREEGRLTSLSLIKSMKIANDWKQTVIFTQNTFKNFAPSISLNQHSKVVWIKGQENYVITLDSHGKVLLHDNLAFSLPIILCKREEKVVKLALSQNYLYMIVKKPRKPYLSYYKVPTETLVTVSPIRTKILIHLRVNLQMIDELNSEYKKIAIKTADTFEIWDLDSEQKEFCTSLVGKLDAKHSKGKAIVLFSVQGNLIVQVIELPSLITHSLAVLGETMPLFYEIVADRLVLIMKTHGVMAITYANSGKECCQINRCVRYYEMEDTNNSFVLLEGGRGVFINNPDRIIQCGVISDIFTSKSDKLIAFSNDSKAIKVISTQGFVEEFSTVGIKRISTIGCNRDS